MTSKHKEKEPFSHSAASAGASEEPTAMPSKNNEKSAHESQAPLAANGAENVRSPLANVSDSLSTQTASMNFEADAGAGLEGTDNSSYAIPFIALLQGLSPVVVDGVEGARPGVMYNTVTEEFYKTLEVIPCAFQRRFVRWTPRAEGGGYKGDYDPVEVETGAIETHRDEENRLKIEGDDLKDTRNHYVLYKDNEGNWQPALISMSSTKIKISRRWMARIRGIMLKGSNGKLFNPPSFSHSYVVGSKSEESPKGKYYNFEISLGNPVADPDVYNYAKMFNQQVLQGVVKATPIDDESAPENGDEEAF